MCGRYVTPEQAAAEREFSLRRSSWHFQARYNVAPSLEVPIVRLSEGGREGLMMRWGLVPFFAHGETPRYSTINARAETLATAASYRAPWRRGQRCLLPAAGRQLGGTKSVLVARPDDKTRQARVPSRARWVC